MQLTKNLLQTNVPLSKPVAVCVAYDDLLLCTDNGHRVVSVSDSAGTEWVIINGQLRKLIAYPEGIYH